MQRRSESESCMGGGHVLDRLELSGLKLEALGAGGSTRARGVRWGSRIVFDHFNGLPLGHKSLQIYRVRAAFRSHLPQSSLACRGQRGR